MILQNRTPTVILTDEAGNQVINHNTTVIIKSHFINLEGASFFNPQGTNSTLFNIDALNPVMERITAMFTRITFFYDRIGK